MILKVGDTVLDFSGPFEMDRKAKLFEEIDTSQGDVSFVSEMPDNGHNRRALGMPLADSLDGKQYHANNAVAMDASGTQIYFGSIRVERIAFKKIQFSFFAGNNNWMRLLTGNLSTLKLDQYDVLQNATDVMATWSETDGLVFPMLDAGELSKRRYINMRPEDFAPGLYMHTIMREVFQEAGLKLTGDLLNDPIYKQAVVISNAKSEEETRKLAANVQKIIDQTLPSNLSFVKMTFDDDSTYPYYNGGSWSLVTNRYTCPVEADYRVKLVLQLSAAHWTSIVLYKNGVATTSHQSVSTQDTNTLNTNIHLLPGDYIEFYARNQVSGGPSVDVTAGNLEIEPTFIYKSFAKAVVPKWTKQQFVSNVLQMFNVIPTFDPFTKTVTLDLFDRVKTRPSIDLSQYINSVETDYIDFISNYARSNRFNYKQMSDEEIERYNASAYVEYGSGEIVADNDFVENTTDVVNSDFSSPFTYVHPQFQCSLERMNLLELVESESTADFATITDSSGQARFNITDADDIFNAGDLVRVESEDSQYNGDYIIVTVTSTYVELYNGAFYTNNPGKITRMRYESTNSSDVFVILHTGVRSVASFSAQYALFLMGTTPITNWAFSFFNLLAVGANVEAFYKYSLAFGQVDNPLAFQRTMLDAYWTLFARMLNSPVKLICQAHLPDPVFKKLDFRSPVTVKTLESSNEYYVNRISGYKGSKYPCEIELIQLP